MIRAAVAHTAAARLAALGVPALAFAGLAFAACSVTLPTPEGSRAPGVSGEPRASGTSGPPVTFGPPTNPTPPDDADPVVLDPALLGWLPASIDGIPVIESVDEAALALTDPGLPRIATALDAAVAVDTASSNLVYALVVRIKPEAFTDVVYQQWRDSFDDGACAAAGGVQGRAEATIDERRVFITTCVAGLRTYHVLLEEPGILVSASSLGEGRFGEKLMDNLRVPA